MYARNEILVEIVDEKINELHQIIRMNYRTGKYVGLGLTPEKVRYVIEDLPEIDDARIYNKSRNRYRVTSTSKLMKILFNVGLWSDLGTFRSVEAFLPDVAEVYSNYFGKRPHGNKRIILNNRYF
jgi:hypothetical protein